MEFVYSRCDHTQSIDIHARLIVLLSTNALVVDLEVETDPSAGSDAASASATARDGSKAPRDGSKAPSAAAGHQLVSHSFIQINFITTHAL